MILTENLINNILLLYYYMYNIEQYFYLLVYSIKCTIQLCKYKGIISVILDNMNTFKIYIKWNKSKRHLKDCRVDKSNIGYLVDVIGT